MSYLHISHYQASGTLHIHPFSIQWWTGIAYRVQTPIKHPVGVLRSSHMVISLRDNFFSLSPSKNPCFPKRILYLSIAGNVKFHIATALTDRINHSHIQIFLPLEIRNGCYQLNSLPPYHLKVILNTVYSGLPSVGISVFM